MVIGGLTSFYNDTTTNVHVLRYNSQRYYISITCHLLHHVVTFNETCLNGSPLVIYYKEIRAIQNISTWIVDIVKI